MTATGVAPLRTASPLASGKGMAKRKAKNQVATVVVYACFLLALIPLVWLLWTVVSRGLSTILSPSWWTNSQAGINYRSGGGGAYHAIIGTAEQVALCTVISVPIAVMVAIYLVEYGRGPIAKVTTFMVDVLTGIPSIVAALFIYAVFITTLGGDRAGWLVSMALVMLMIPVIVRTTEEMLKLVPNELREASYALGVPKWKTILRIVLPTASSGIITGIMLGVARVAGETAPLLVLVGYSKLINFDLLNGFQGSLPGLMFDQVSQLGNVRYTFAADRLWGTALTLVLIILVLNLLARLIARRSKLSS
ncbi:phosphate ABC transporter permease PstA [Jatrophihabitans sp. YIM 134969]